MASSFLSSWVEWDHADCFPSVLEPIGFRLAPKQMEDFRRELSPLGLELGTKLLEARNFGRHFFCGWTLLTFKFQIVIHILILFLISLVKRFYYLVFNFKSYLILNRVLEWNFKEYPYCFHISACYTEATWLKFPPKLDGMGSCWEFPLCFGPKWISFGRNRWNFLIVNFLHSVWGWARDWFPKCTF